MTAEMTVSLKYQLPPQNMDFHVSFSAFLGHIHSYYYYVLQNTGRGDNNSDDALNKFSTVEQSTW